MGQDDNASGHAVRKPRKQNETAAPNMRNAATNLHPRKYVFVVRWCAERRRFEIHEPDGQYHGAFSDKDIAVKVAIEAAKLANACGNKAIVCVEQEDGSRNTEWDSKSESA